ncbi:MAG: YncE family protein [Bacillota bacterium]|nr:YncE family protein [Bacillota bacterium]
MDFIYICNTSSGNISKVNLKNFREELKISLYSETDDSAGPHGLFRVKDKMYAADSYSNSLSIIDLKYDAERENFKIGGHPNDVIVIKDKAYIICGDTNSVIIFDLISKKITGEIKTGLIPHSITYYNDKLLISNMGNDTLTVVNIKKNYKVNTVKLGPFPTKAIFAMSGRLIIACESNIGSDNEGSISFIDAHLFKVIYRISIGRCPVNLYVSDNFCFVSNFGDGTLSIVNLKYKEEIKRIEVGGAPSGLIVNNKNVYLTDNYNNKLVRINLFNMEIKKVSIGGEPTAMILIH